MSPQNPPYVPQNGSSPSPAGVLPGSAEALHALIRREALTVAWQPIVDLRTGALAAYEGLTRPDPSTGFERPDQLFAAAERCGALMELENVIRRRARESSRLIPPGVQLTLNFSPSVFARAEFPEAMRELTDGPGGVDPARVIIELTERATQDMDAVGRNAAVLSARGFSIAVDDVGAGSSGLNRIMALRPHWLKLDAELVDQVDVDPYRQNMLRFFVHFARMCGASLVAEGVERVPELGALIDLGVSLGQGYLMGKATPGADPPSETISAWIRERCALRDRVALRDPRRRPISELASPVTVCPASRKASEAARELTDASCAGVAVLDGRRLVGWAHRDELLRLAGTNPDAPARLAVRHPTHAVEPTTTLGEAAWSLAVRDEPSIGEPIIIARGAEALGVVRVRDLLQALSNTGADGADHTIPLTGLPDRVLCDQQIGRLIAARAPGDAVFVDVRGMERLNARAGYESGDMLLRHIAAALQSTVGLTAEETFVWHIGSDEFVAASPGAAVGDRLEELVLQFDTALVRYRGPDGSDPPTLRVVVIPDAFQRVESVRALHALAETLRRRSGPASPSGSTIIVDTAGMEDSDRLRKSA